MSNNLQSELNASIANSNRLRDEIDKQELAKKLPALKRKYEGQYYKAKTTYGSGNKKFSIYYRVICVEDLRHVDVVKFQTDNYGKIFIERDKNYYPELLGRKITQNEYNQAYRDMYLGVERTINGK